MKRFDYRRKAVLARIHHTLDNFYLRQEIDWDYDVRMILDRILELAMEELEFGEGKMVDRGLIIVSVANIEALEVRAGWRVDEEQDLEFSHTIVEETIKEGRSILCENALEDPRFGRHVTAARRSRRFPIHANANRRCLEILGPRSDLSWRREIPPNLEDLAR